MSKGDSERVCEDERVRERRCWRGEGIDRRGLEGEEEEKAKRENVGKKRRRVDTSVERDEERVSLHISSHQ